MALHLLFGRNTAPVVTHEEPVPPVDSKFHKDYFVDIIEAFRYRFNKERGEKINTSYFRRHARDLSAIYRIVYLQDDNYFVKDGEAIDSDVVMNRYRIKMLSLITQAARENSRLEKMKEAVPFINLFEELRAALDGDVHGCIAYTIDQYLDNPEAHKFRGQPTDTFLAIQRLAEIKEQTLRTQIANLERRQQEQAAKIAAAQLESVLADVGKQLVQKHEEYRETLTKFDEATNSKRALLKEDLFKLLDTFKQKGGNIQTLHEKITPTLLMEYESRPPVAPAAQPAAAAPVVQAADRKDAAKPAGGAAAVAGVTATKQPSPKPQPSVEWDFFSGASPAPAAAGAGARHSVMSPRNNGGGSA